MQQKQSNFAKSYQEGFQNNIQVLLAFNNIHNQPNKFKIQLPKYNHAQSSKNKLIQIVVKQFESYSQQIHQLSYEQVLYALFAYNQKYMAVGNSKYNNNSIGQNNLLNSSKLLLSQPVKKHLFSKISRFLQNKNRKNKQIKSAYKKLFEQVSKQQILNDIHQLRNNLVNQNWKFIDSSPQISDYLSPQAQNIKISGRQILSKLSQIKTQMNEYQIQMNILGKKRNQQMDKKIIEHVGQYNKKRKEYNIFKEKYRFKTLMKNKKCVSYLNQINSTGKLMQQGVKNNENNQLNKISSQFNQNNVVQNQPGNNKISIDLNLNKSKIVLNTKPGSNNKSIEQQSKQTNEVNKNESQQIQNKLQKGNVQQQNKKQSINNLQQQKTERMDSKKSTGRKSKKSQSKNSQINNFQKKQLNKNSTPTEHVKFQQHNTQLSQSKLINPNISNLKTKNELDHQMIDNLVVLLKQIQKQIVKKQRIQQLSNNLIPQSNNQSHKHNTNINNISQTLQVAYQQRNKKIQRLRTTPALLLQSQKQFLLQKYIKKVFNFYIMQQKQYTNFNTNINNSLVVQKSIKNDRIITQSPMGYILLADDNSRNRLENPEQVENNRTFITQGNQESRFNSKNKNQQIQRRKKLSLQFQNKQKCKNDDMLLFNIRNNRKMMSLGQGKNVQYNLLNYNTYQNKFKQAQMTLQSYSKFIRTFQLTNKNITFNDIVQLFKSKSSNKRSITYYQFLQLFQDIYRKQCQKLDIQFQPKLLDSYMQKQIFNFDKINKVLRLKPIQLLEKAKLNQINVSQVGKSKTQASTPKTSNYKFNVQSHSGHLSQNIIQKLDVSRKPFLAMPCMNTTKQSRKKAISSLPSSKSIKNIQDDIRGMKRHSIGRRLSTSSEYTPHVNNNKQDSYYENLKKRKSLKLQKSRISLNQGKQDAKNNKQTISNIKKYSNIQQNLSQLSSQINQSNLNKKKQINHQQNDQIKALQKLIGIRPEQQSDQQQEYDQSFQYEQEQSSYNPIQSTHQIATKPISHMTKRSPNKNFNTIQDSHVYSQQPGFKPSSNRPIINVKESINYSQSNDIFANSPSRYNTPKFVPKPTKFITSFANDSEDHNVQNKKINNIRKSIEDQEAKQDDYQARQSKVRKNISKVKKINTSEDEYLARYRKIQQQVSADYLQIKRAKQQQLYEKYRNNIQKIKSSIQSKQLKNINNSIQAKDKWKQHFVHW